jgi:hypothetical protein
MHTQDKINIRTMTRSDIDIAIEWAAREGWNPGLSDADCFYNADPKGFFIAEFEGEPVGTISAVSYTGIFGFIGLFIIKPDYRSTWTAFHLTRAATRHLKGCNIGLDGVLERIDSYAKLGYKFAYKNARYGGKGQKYNYTGVSNLSDVPFEDLVEYDAGMFSVPRPQFLKKWINQPDGTALGTLVNGKLAGYGVIRPCREGFKIGPLFAETPELADNLFKALSGAADGENIYLDTPCINRGAVNLALNYGMKIVFETARMYSGETDFLPINKIFGITTFELG